MKEEVNNGTLVKKQRESNLELYRIICMLMIVAHHYVVNSGLTSMGGVLTSDLTSWKSLFLTLFGAWGKTGINCFLMITGYYMCTSTITLRKFLKLMAQIYFYKIIIYTLFYMSGSECFTPIRIIKLVMPAWGFNKNDFVGCFIFFWLSIPFLNILIKNMSKRQHGLLLLLLLGVYTVLGNIPTFNIAFNYITWFSVIYFIASYIRLYPQSIFERKLFWGCMTFISIAIAMVSVVVMRHLVGIKGIGYSHFFVSDSNKFLAVAVAICSFIWFKNINLKYSKIINAFGAGTFGVLLIHANSDAMRTWLWKDTVDVVGHYLTMNVGSLALYSVGVVLAIFIICNLIDQLRIATLEKWFFCWYDRVLDSKANKWISRIMKE